MELGASLLARAPRQEICDTSWLSLSTLPFHNEEAGRVERFSHEMSHFS